MISRPSGTAELDTEAPFVEPDEETRAKLEAENGLRQYDRLVEMIGAGLGKRSRLRPSQMMELNRVAIEGLVSHPGAVRHVRNSVMHFEPTGQSDVDHRGAVEIPPADL